MDLAVPEGIRKYIVCIGGNPSLSLRTAGNQVAWILNPAKGSGRGRATDSKRCPTHRAAVSGKAYVRRPMSDPLGDGIRAQPLLELKSKPEVSDLFCRTWTREGASGIIEEQRTLLVVSGEWWVASGE